MTGIKKGPYPFYGRLLALGIGLASASVPAGAPVTDRAAAAAWRSRGVQAGYNLDYDEAVAAFEQAIEADPTDPAPHRLMAATIWIRLLFQRGAITVDDYLGEARSDLARDPPPPAMDTFFHTHVDRALALAEARLRDAPASADSHYQVGAATALMATYAGTVTGSGLSGFRPARRAYDEHERVMAIDPRRKDAALVVGTYRYAVSTLSPPWRLLAHLAGFGGGRARGLQLVEEAADFPGEVQTNARFILILLYNREGRYDDALRVIAQLQREHPGNRLLWLEAGGTALRAGRPAEARLAIERGLEKLAQDPRPRGFGEEARWRLAHGTALAALGERQPAEQVLRAALTAEARDWIRGRVHNELGTLADLAGDRAGATAQYRIAVALCQADHDPACADEAKRRMRRGGPANASPTR
ncbi:MAG: tetratricopeptide repeat protein [Acidobacteriota bacterium]